VTRLKTLRPSVGLLSSGIGSAVSAGTGFSRLDGRSSTARGYGADWRRVRAQVLADEPLCRFCAAAGRTTAAAEVDHIESFTGLSDPRRLDRRNLRPLCTPCHRTRTARQSGDRRGGA
jgi:5-methylcytosine-specific restriction endonuclease McrA